MAGIEAIREANERARLENETARLSAETAAITGAVQPGMAVPQPQSVMEGWGDLVPLTDYPWNDTHFTGRSAGGYSSMQGAMLGDRRGGRHPPVVWTEDNLTAIRAAMRVLCEVNCSAKSAMLNLKNYVMGTGFSYDMKPVKGADVSSGLLGTARTVLQEFLSENHWTGETEKPSREKELFERAHRDGEYFVALYHRGDGHVQVRVIEPEQVTEPDDPEMVEREIDWMDRPSDWEFGVHTDEQDTEQVYGYHVRWRGDEFDTWAYFPEERMVHCKLNVDGTIKRGLSDFFPVYQILEKAAKLVLNVAEGASILSAIAYICEHAPGVDQSQIEAMRASGDWARFNLPTLTEGSRTRHVHKIEPGTRIDVPKGQKYLASPLAQRGVGEAMVTIHEGICRTAGSNWAMPEWMISGSSQGAAYAASLVIESPFAKNAQSLQNDSIGNYKAVIWKVFKIAHEHGRFDEYGVSLNDLRRVLVIDVQPPIVAARDLDKETNRRKVLHDNGVLKGEIWAREEGYEFDSEFYEKRIKSQTAMNQFGTASQPQGPASTPFRQGKPQHPLAEDRLQEAASLLWGSYPGIGGAECPAGQTDNRELNTENSDDA